MLNKTLNGFTVIAHEWSRDSYVILAFRLTGPATYEYVTARVQNIDSDREWFWGTYFTNVEDAIVNYAERKVA